MERTTNHDVKAVEYVLKEAFAKHPELSKVGASIQGLQFQSLRLRKRSLPSTPSCASLNTNIWGTCPCTRCWSSRILPAPARTSTTWRTGWRSRRGAPRTCCPPLTPSFPVSFQYVLLCEVFPKTWRAHLLPALDAVIACAFL